MRTVVLGPVPNEIADLIERRRKIGADTHDEVWEGEYHMSPAPDLAHSFLDNELAVVLTPLARTVGLVSGGPCNIGGPDNYRVPDRVLHRGRPAGVWALTAALVVEILSPDDESWAKLDFYAAHGVDEVVMADHRTTTLTWLTLVVDRYEQTDFSQLLGVSVAEIAGSISWPPPHTE